MSSENTAEKQTVIEKYKRHETDCGSTEVQVALLTKHLEKLTGHFKNHPGDIHSKRGMYRVISQRKQLLQYLRERDVPRYRDLISSLGLRK